MKPTKQPLITIEEKDCENCNPNQKEDVFNQWSKVIKYHSFGKNDCESCQGRGKSPNTLIFDEYNPDFKCKNGLWTKEHIKGMQVTIDHKYCSDCKSTGYLLPKKGELMEFDKKERYKTINGEDRVGISKQKFRLSSDAVLKSIGDKIKEGCHCAGGDCEICQLVTMINNHNLSESSKIVIFEGYYE